MRLSIIGPGALCRLDDTLLARIREGRDHRSIAWGCALTIAVGAGAYGAALGAWRGPEQSLYSAIKLPIVLFALVASTTAMNTMLAALLRSKLGVKESALAALVGLAITAALLGAVAPVAWFLVVHAPTANPELVGLEYSSRKVTLQLPIANKLLLFHVAVIASAGVIGVWRLHSLLRRLIDDPAVARRVLFGWLAVEALVGSELSWLMRPFLGKPHLAPSFFRHEALEGNFFEEASTLLSSVFGSSGPYVGFGFVALLLGALVVNLARNARLRAALLPTGLELTRLEGDTTFFVAWAEIGKIERRGDELEVRRRVPGELADETLLIRCDDRAAAHRLQQDIEITMERGRHGPFRTRASREEGAGRT